MARPPESKLKPDRPAAFGRCHFPYGGSAPKPPGFAAFAPRYSFSKPKMGRSQWGPPRPISASESALGSHPCVALSSAQLNFHIGRNLPALNRPIAQHTVLPITPVNPGTTHPVGSGTRADAWFPVRAQASRRASTRHARVRAPRRGRIVTVACRRSSDPPGCNAARQSGMTAADRLPPPAAPADRPRSPGTFP